MLLCTKLNRLRQPQHRLDAKCHDAKLHHKERGILSDKSGRAALYASNQKQRGRFHCFRMQTTDLPFFFVNPRSPLRPCSAWNIPPRPQEKVKMMLSKWC